MKERITKKILAIFLTIAMCLTLMPMTAFADTDTPKIENVNISEEGILTFDEVPGAVRYKVRIINESIGKHTPGTYVSLGTNIFETIMERYKCSTARYGLAMWAYNSEDRICAALNDEDEYYIFDYRSPLIELTAPTNLRWDGYTARWDEVPNCGKYEFILYNEYGTVVVIRETEDNFYEYSLYALKDGYYFTVQAIGGDGYINSERSTKSPRWKIPVVREVNIVVTPPIAGEIPDYNASTDSTECTVDDNEVGWVDSDTRIVSSTSSPRPLEAGHRYDAVVWLTPNSGYIFDESTVVKINGKAASKTNEGTRLAQFSREFSVDESIREVDVRITPPIAGEIPDYNASTDSTECTVRDNKVLWKDKDTGVWYISSDNKPLEAGHTYIASIWLKPKSGYKIDENTVVKINGMTAYKGASSSDLSGELIQFTREFTVDGTANLYSVNFDSTGGSEVAAQTVEENGVVTRPADPVRDGYNFEGWYTEAECINAYDFNSQITGDITLFAKWVKKDTEGSGSGSGRGTGSGSGSGSGTGGGSGTGSGSGTGCGSGSGR